MLFQWTVKCTVKKRLLEAYSGPPVWVLVIYFKELKRLSFSWRTDEFVINPTLRDHQSYHAPLAYRIWQQIWKIEVFILWAFPLAWTFFTPLSCVHNPWWKTCRNKHHYWGTAWYWQKASAERKGPPGKETVLWAIFLSCNTQELPSSSSCQVLLWCNGLRRQGTWCDGSCGPFPSYIPMLSSPASFVTGIVAEQLAGRTKGRGNGDTWWG